MVRLVAKRVRKVTLNYQLMFGIDKLMHFIGFAGISVFIGIFILIISDHHRAKRQMSVVWLTLVTIGIIEEYRQYLDPDRSTEFMDAMANIAGVTTGLAIPLLISYLIKYRQQILSKVVSLYSLVLFSLLIGLLYFNERPIITTKEAVQENIRNLASLIGW